MNEIKVQEFTQLAPSTSFTLGYDDGFIFAYRIKNTQDKENPIYTFNHTGYLDIKVDEVTYKYSKTIIFLIFFRQQQLGIEFIQIDNNEIMQRTRLLSHRH
jgi:hypothetical protein